MTLANLLEWWNLIYVIPFALALLYLGLFVFTGITFGEADADADMDGDADVGGEASLDGDSTVHVEAHVLEGDADTDADADHDAEAPGAALVHGHTGPQMLAHSVDMGHDAGDHGSLFGTLLSFLGVGKIPISLALMTLLFCWGMVGFAINALLLGWMGSTPLIGLISLPVTLLVSLALTGLVAALIAKIIPNDDSVHERRADLVGKAGEAMYDINAEFGMAMVRGNAGDFFQVPCRTAAGKPGIPKGARIVLFDYDGKQGVFQAAPFEA